MATTLIDVDYYEELEKKAKSFDEIFVLLSVMIKTSEKEWPESVYKTGVVDGLNVALSRMMEVIE